MPPKAPNGLRWCKQCDKYLSINKFGNYKTALCHKHWLIWNKNRSKKYSREHPGYDAERTRRWAKNNPEKYKAKCKRNNKNWKKRNDNYKKAHPERMRDIWRRYGKKWYKNNPEKAFLQGLRKYKNRKKLTNIGYCTSDDLKKIIKHFDYKCAYCGNKYSSWDHIIPVSRGGTNFSWNLIPSCKSCNSKKCAKTVEDFLKSNLNISNRAKKYILKAIEKNKSFLNKYEYERNVYERIPKQCLLDELNKIYKKYGIINYEILSKSKYGKSTYLRRLGNINSIRQILTKKVEKNMKSKPLLWIEGLIGSGKSSLAEIISKKFNFRIMKEPIDENPYLEDFYKDQKKHAFAMQMHLLEVRSGLQDLAAAEVMFGNEYSGVILDRALPGDFAFCRLHKLYGNISEINYETYKIAYLRRTNSMKPPALLIFLDVTPETALRRIKKRSRNAEVNITLKYLSDLRDQYNDMLVELKNGVHEWCGKIEIKYLAWNSDNQSLKTLLEYLKNHFNLVEQNKFERYPRPIKRFPRSK